MLIRTILLFSDETINGEHDPPSALLIPDRLFVNFGRVLVIQRWDPNDGLTWYGVQATLR